jgi:sugar phosphate isomerase/epimerase
LIEGEGIKMRIYKDILRDGDYYRVVRKGHNIYIKHVADSNTTFTWPSPEKDGYIVNGFRTYEGERQGTYQCKVLDMVISAIVRAMGEAGERDIDYPDNFSTLKEEKEDKRRFVEQYIGYIPEEK